jgi:hypothetical protein
LVDQVAGGAGLTQTACVWEDLFGLPHEAAVLRLMLMALRIACGSSQVNEESLSKHLDLANYAEWRQVLCCHHGQNMVDSEFARILSMASRRNLPG